MTEEPSPEQRTLQMAVDQVERSLEERSQAEGVTPEERARYEAAQAKLRTFADGPDSTASHLVDGAVAVSRWVRWIRLAVFIVIAIVVLVVFLTVR